MASLKGMNVEALTKLRTHSMKGLLSFGQSQRSSWPLSRVSLRARRYE
jgi:hypothetical protein